MLSTATNMAASTSLVLAEEQVRRKPNVTEIIPPVDYSFLRLTQIGECEAQEPRNLLTSRKPPIKSKNVTQDGETKYLSKCLRLNNNKLADVNSLMSLAVSLFEHPANIGWIDLSFNILTHIDPVLTQFENLRILYLHGNNITELKEVNKLAQLKYLWKLTLHGNDVEKIKGYRQYVLSAIPTLVSFDFSTVTKGDRLTANTWSSFNSDKHHKKRITDAE